MQISDGNPIHVNEVEFYKNAIYNNLSFEKLPDEVLLSIFFQLNNNELLAAGQASKSWKNIVDHVRMVKLEKENEIYKIEQESKGDFKVLSNELIVSVLASLKYRKDIQSISKVNKYFNEICEKYFFNESYLLGNFKILPEEMMENIFSHLNIEEIFNLSRLNTSWKKIMLEKKLHIFGKILKIDDILLVEKLLYKCDKLNILKDIENLIVKISKEDSLLMQIERQISFKQVASNYKHDCKKISGVIVLSYVGEKLIKINKFENFLEFVSPKLYDKFMMLYFDSLVCSLISNDQFEHALKLVKLQYKIDDSIPIERRFRKKILDELELGYYGLFLTHIILGFLKLNKIDEAKKAYELLENSSFFKYPRQMFTKRDIIVQFIPLYEKDSNIMTDLQREIKIAEDKKDRNFFNKMQYRIKLTDDEIEFAEFEKGFVNITSSNNLGDYPQVGESKEDLLSEKKNKRCIVS